MQIRSVFGQTETAQRLNVNISLCKSTFWHWVALIEKLNTAVSRNLCEQNSIEIKKIKNTSRNYMERRWKQNAMDSQNLQRYIHIMNSIIN